MQGVPDLFPRSLLQRPLILAAKSFILIIRDNWYFSKPLNQLRITNFFLFLRYDHSSPIKWISLFAHNRSDSINFTTSYDLIVIYLAQLASELSTTLFVVSSVRSVKSLFPATTSCHESLLSQTCHLMTRALLLLF